MHEEQAIQIIIEKISIAIEEITSKDHKVAET